MSSRKAIIWSLLAGYLLLPVKTGFDAPGIPNMDKTLIPNLSVLLCALIFAKHKVISIPKNAVLIGLMALYVASPFLTTFNNGEPLLLSVSALPGMTLYDGIALSVKQMIELIPFMIAYSAFKTEADVLEILKALVVAALAYSVLIMWEVRMSPQLHTQIYGFFPHDFGQQMRAGGFRSVVFLGHGLIVAIFVAMALIAAIGLWRNRVRIKGVPGFAYTGILIFVLIISKSFGALLLAIFVGAATYLLKYRRLVTILAISGLVIIAYPALRGVDLIPVDRFAAITADYSEDRAGSFQTRIDNEEKLLEKTERKPFFGWGTWGRGRVYTTDWQGNDVDTTITDGTWIIIISSFGWIGYIACFGLLAYPTFRALRYRRQFSQSGPCVVLLAVLVINLFDLLPNASLSPITWLIAGALSGYQIVPYRKQKSASANSALTRIIETAPKSSVPA